MRIGHHVAMRAAVMSAIPLAAVALWTPATNAYEPAKLLILVLAATFMVAGTVAVVIQMGILPRPPLPLVVAAGVFGLVLVVATVTANDPLLALVGVRGRYGGLMTYACVIAVILLTPSITDVRLGRRTLELICVALGVVVLIGLLQTVGVDPVDRGSDIAVTSTFGNSNFAAAWPGAALAAVVWLGLSARGWDARRWTAVGLGVAALVFIAATRALQGFPSALAAVTPVAFVASAPMALRWRRLIRGGLLAVIGVGVVSVIAGVLGQGPGAFLAQETGVRLRGHYWDAALQMAADAPMTGVGLDGYAASYRLVRTPDAARAVDLLTSADAAHSVPLHFLAGGGVPLLLAYVCVIGVTGFLLLRGLLRLQGEARLVLAAVSGLWLAYQVQSLVSIDVPALMTLHAVSAGLGVGLAVSPHHDIRLPWAPQPPKTKKGRPSKGSKARRARLPSARRKAIARGVAVVLGVIGLLVAIQPLRADMAMYRTLRAEAFNDPQGAIVAGEDAAAIGFWDPAYDHRAGISHQRAGAIDDALVFFGQVDQRGVGQFDSALSAARGLEDTDPQRAEEWFDRALQLEPTHPELLFEVARFYAAHDRDEDARVLVDRILANDPDNTDAVDLRSQLASS